MFRPSPAIVAWGLMARNPQAETERLAFWKTTAATRGLAVEREGWMSLLPAGSLAWLMVPVLMRLLLDSAGTPVPAAALLPSSSANSSSRSPSSRPFEVNN